ncbi:MAG: hypothetical protein WC734_03170 [Patescibacteria group bacterium]|jgi:hypothetical protein
MTEGRFYHIYIVPKESVAFDTVEQKMNLAVDWFRYNSKNWVVYSTSDVEKWVSRLQPLVEPTGDLFVCELNIQNRNGWMSKKFWEWIKKER